MDPNVLKNLGLDGKMNQSDLNLISQILSSNMGNGNNKVPKMSAKEKNNLINKLSSNNTLSEIPQKELKDMNEEEKKIYREELRKKLKNKQNEKKMLRTNNISKNKNKYNDALNKISDMMKNIPNDVLSNNINSSNVNLDNNIQDNNIQDNKIQDNNIQDNKIYTVDKINYLINKNYNNEEQNDSNKEPIVEDLDDYLN